MVTNDKLVTTCKNMVMTYFKVQFWHLLTETEESDKKLMTASNLAIHLSKHTYSNKALLL